MMGDHPLIFKNSKMIFVDTLLQLLQITNYAVG